MIMEFKHLQTISHKLAQKYDLSLIVLFGSQVDGTQRGDSDYDIAIMSNKKITSEDFFNIINNFTEKLETDVDIVVLNQIEDPLLLNNIARQSKVLFEKESGLYDEFVVNSIFNYIDYSPLYNIEEEIVNKKLENL